MSEETISIPTKFARFLKAVMESTRDAGGCDIDGGWLQGQALDMGVLIETQVTESCGGDCVCAEYGFPSECYRYSPEFKAMLTAIKS